MTDRKELLNLDDAAYYAGRNKHGGPIVIMQAKADGSEEHPVGSYDQEKKKFKWDAGSVRDLETDLEEAVLKAYGA